MDEFERAIQLLTSMLVRSMKADDALKITQAALNLAHTKSVLQAVATGEPRVKKSA